MSKIRSENLKAETGPNHSDSIIPAVLSLARTYSHVKGASTLEELIRFADALQTQSPQQIHNIYITLPEECKIMLCEQTQENLKDPAFCLLKLDAQEKQKVTGEIRQCKSNLVSSILVSKLFCAGVLLYTQLDSLLELSEKLKQTGKLVEESKLKIDDIIKKLDKLKARQIELNQAVESVKMKATEQTSTATQQSLDQATLLELYCDFSFLNNEKTEALLKIEKLKVEVSGNIVRLGDQSKAAIRDACVDATQIVSNFIEYNMAGDMYSGALKGVMALITTAFAFMGVAKYQQSQQVAMQIEELADILNQVKALEKEMKKFNKVIMAAIEWIKEKMKKKSEGDGGRTVAEMAGQSAI